APLGAGRRFEHFREVLRCSSWGSFFSRRSISPASAPKKCKERADSHVAVAGSPQVIESLIGLRSSSSVIKASLRCVFCEISEGAFRPAEDSRHPRGGWPKSSATDRSHRTAPLLAGR